MVYRQWIKFVLIEKWRVTCISTFSWNEILRWYTKGEWQWLRHKEISQEQLSGWTSILKCKRIKYNNFLITEFFFSSGSMIYCILLLVIQIHGWSWCMERTSRSLCLFTNVGYLFFYQFVYQTETGCSCTWTLGWYIFLTSSLLCQWLGISKLPSVTRSCYYHTLPFHYTTSPMLM